MVYVPKGCQLPYFYVPTCHKACYFFKHSSYEMLKEISILYYFIKNPILHLISELYISYVYVSYIKIVLYLISALHAILKKSVEFLLFETFFCSLVRSGTIKRPGFYTLQVKRIFLSFPHLKQINKFKNMCQ